MIMAEELPKTTGFWCEVASATTISSREAVWSAIKIWIKKPHLVNRRLCGTENLESFENWQEVLQRGSKQDAEPWLKDLAEYAHSVETSEVPIADGIPDSRSISVRTLIPRNAVYKEIAEAVITGWLGKKVS